jgi:hypothetical protein
MRMNVLLNFGGMMRQSGLKEINLNIFNREAITLNIFT